MVPDRAASFYGNAGDQCKAEALLNRSTARLISPILKGGKTVPNLVCSDTAEKGTLLQKYSWQVMDQLTLLLAASTRRLSDVMKLMREQEALINTLHAQGRPAAGAEALLEIFKEAATALTEQRKRLEGQMVFLAQKSSHEPKVGWPNGIRWIQRLFRRASGSWLAGGTRATGS